jgi:hypothetical protein
MPSDCTPKFFEYHNRVVQKFQFKTLKPVDPSIKNLYIRVV